MKYTKNIPLSVYKEIDTEVFKNNIDYHYKVALILKEQKI
jgi:hypothetical protein